MRKRSKAFGIILCTAVATATAPASLAEQETAAGPQPGGSVAAQDTQNESGDALSPRAKAGLLGLIGLSGLLGGVLFYYLPPGERQAVDGDREPAAIAIRGSDYFVPSISGIAGAFTIWVIVGEPKDPLELGGLLRVIGLSIGGGYAGVSVVQQSVNSTIARQGDTIKSQAKEIQKVKGQEKADSRWLSTIRDQLDAKNERLTADALKERMQAASEVAVEFAYHAALQKLDNARDELSQAGDVEEARHEYEELRTRVIDVYTAIASDKLYWVWGQLGLLLQEFGDYPAAAEAFERAIDGRGEPPLFRYLIGYEANLLRSRKGSVSIDSHEGKRLIRGLEARLSDDYLGRQKGQRLADSWPEAANWLRANLNDKRLETLKQRLDAAGVTI